MDSSDDKCRINIERFHENWYSQLSKSDIMPYRYLRPSDILYNQDSISDHFRDGTSINETLNDLKNERLSIDDIPKITVYKRGSDWVTKNNRRLWVFRRLEACGRCDTIPANVEYHADAESYFRTDIVQVRRGGNTVTANTGMMLEEEEADDVAQAHSTAGNVAIGFGLAALIGGGLLAAGAIARHRQRDN